MRGKTVRRQSEGFALTDFLCRHQLQEEIGRVIVGGRPVLQPFEKWQKLAPWSPVGKLALAGQEGDVGEEHVETGRGAVDGHDDNALGRTERNDFEEEANQLAHH